MASIEGVHLSFLHAQIVLSWLINHDIGKWLQ